MVETITVLRTLRQNVALSMTVHNIYGIGLIISTLYLDFAQKYKLRLVTNTIIITLLLVGLECIGGQLSYLVNGRKTWNYDSHLVSICDGYVSFPTTSYFMILILTYIKFLYPCLS